MRYVFALLLLAGCSSTGWHDIATGQPIQGRDFGPFGSEIEVVGTVPREALRRK